MKNQKNSKKVAAGVLAAQIVLQAAAMNIPAFADDVQADVLETAENTNVESVVSDSADDTLTISSGTSVPEEIVEGKSVSVKGTVCSGVSNISKISAGVYDKDNNCVASGSVDVNEKTFDLSQLDSKIAFNSLPAGDYSYRVVVSNASNTDYVLVDQNFTVTSNGEEQTSEESEEEQVSVSTEEQVTAEDVSPSVSQDNITISGNNTVPDTLKKGSAYSIQGTVTSEQSDLIYLTAGVYNANGEFVTGRTIAPKTKSYDIRKLDSYVSFGKLEEGKYIYAVIATNSAHTNVALVTKQFTVVGENGEVPAVTNDKLTLTDGTEIPDHLDKGKFLSVKGVVTSENSNITSLTVGVYDANNNLVTGKTVEPNAKSYRLANVDSFISFNTLTDGIYTYSVTATNGANKDAVIYSKQFMVGNAQVAPLDELKITNGTTVPEKLAKGKAVSVKGTVSSSNSNITSLTVGIYENSPSGQAVIQKTVTPNAKSYDLHALDNDIAFSKLSDGTYAYVVTASNANSTNFIVTNQTFVVGNGTQATDDKISVTNGTVVPDTIAKGKAITVKGTINSVLSNITSLTVGVYDANNKLVTGKTITPNAKSYNLNKLDNDVAFSALADGVYTYAVIATNSASKDFVVTSKKFTVGNGGTATDDKLSVSNGTSVPATLTKGKAVTVKGTITSASSNITELTVGVYDTSTGKLVTGKTVNPNAKSYDLHNLDNDVLFTKLTDGNYTYCVIATNSANKNFKVVETKFTVGNGASATNDKLTISGGTTVPDTLAKGKTLAIKGTVTSASSNMTSLTVGVYDSNGKFVTGRTIAPNVKTYDLSRLDSYVAFNTLGEGTYTYAVIASNAANTNYALVSKKFTIGSGSSSTATNDKLTISGSTAVPDTLAKGKALSVTGTVTSASSNMTALTVGVYDSNGKFVTGRTINPNAKTYDLRKLDSYVAFNTLSEGSYIYAVIASNAANTNYALVSKRFTVGNSGTSTSTDALKITGGTVVPDNIAKGKSLSVTGTVTSASSNMTALTVGVYDTNGKFITGRTIAPNAKTYDLRRLDSYVAFNTLAEGNYIYAVIASNAANTNYALVSKRFTVGSGSSATNTSDKLTISNGTSVPSSIAKGKGVSVRGTVTSSSSNITSLTVGVYDSNGKLVTGKTIAPNAKSYNLSRLDSSVRFDQLAAGDYTYRVIATNSGNNSATLVNQSFAVK